MNDQQISDNSQMVLRPTVYDTSPRQGRKKWYIFLFFVTIGTLFLLGLYYLRTGGFIKKFSTTTAPQLIKQNTILNPIAYNYQITRLASVSADILSASTSFIRFSPDGRQVAYLSGNAGEQYVVLNGVQQPTYVKVDNLTFSPDGKRFFYKAYKKGGTSLLTSLVVDGVEGAWYDEILYPAFSPDSKRFLYVANSYSSRENPIIKQWVVIDGIEGKKYDTLGIPIFSPDSKHVVYTADTAVIEDEKVKYTYSTILSNKILTNSDGSKYAYNGFTQQGDIFQAVNGSIIATYKPIYEFAHTNFIFSPDSQKYAYIIDYADDTGDAVVIGKSQGKEYKVVSTPVFSPDSQHIYYLAKQGITNYLVKDGVELGVINGDFESALLISPDGSTVAFEMTRNGNHILQVNNTEYPNIVPFSQLITFSPIGNDVGYVAVEQNKFAVMVNGKKIGKDYDHIYSLSFSPDGSKVMYGAALDGSLWWIVENVK